MAGAANTHALAIALCELALTAGPFLHTGGRMSERQKRLLAALCHARGVLNGETLPCPLDPDHFLQMYIAGGGDWRALVAAVNRNSTDAVVQRHQHQHQDGLCRERNPQCQR